MAVYTISDLHLSFGAKKPMNIFKGWENYEQRIAANWERMITPDDTVVLPGDFSWSMKLPETVADFAFLHRLPGKKIILKGNHDLWWSTMKKITAFLEENRFDSILPLHNNAYVAEGYAVCGRRGWFYDAGEADQKIVLREAGRLETSIAAAEATGQRPLVFLHYPPVYGEYVCGEIMEVLQKHNVKDVYHGHIHGAGHHNAVAQYEGISFHLVSCDCMDFTPFCIAK